MSHDLIEQILVQGSLTVIVTAVFMGLYFWLRRTVRKNRAEEL